jgi:hypothetical protein
VPAGRSVRDGIHHPPHSRESDTARIKRRCRRVEAHKVPERDNLDTHAFREPSAASRRVWSGRPNRRARSCEECEAFARMKHCRPRPRSMARSRSVLAVVSPFTAQSSLARTAGGVNIRSASFRQFSLPHANRFGGAARTIGLRCAYDRLRAGGRPDRCSALPPACGSPRHQAPPLSKVWFVPILRIVLRGALLCFGCRRPAGGIYVP